MQVSPRDWWATALVALAVLVYAVTDQGWNVWLIGSSHRWAAGVIGVLGWACCALGRPTKGAITGLLSVVGVAALAALVVALLTGSLAAVGLLVLAMVVLWLFSTLRHLGARRPTHA